MSGPLPLLALTLGDPSGVGPEIALRLLAEPPPDVRLLVVGSRAALRREQRNLAAELPAAALPTPVVDPWELPSDDGPWVAAWNPARGAEDALPPPGVVDARAGRLSHDWVIAAADLALRGTVDAVVTGPIHKQAWRAAGIASPGHTEALRDHAGCARVLMLFAAGLLRVGLATIHLPLRDVPERLTVPDLLATLRLLAGETARLFGPARPRIAVCGLNPHAGEGGLLGAEDEAVVRPAVEAARAAGVDAHGPLPADACIPQAASGGWDAVLAMFHDQALPAAKAIAPRTSVNVTAGLPFLRTSVDHGTAFDIAGRGRADPTSLYAAVDLAATICRRLRSERGNSTASSARARLNPTRPPSDLSS